MPTYYRGLVQRWGGPTVAAAFLGIVGTLIFLYAMRDVATGGRFTSFDRVLLLRGHQLAVSPDGRWLTPTAKILSMLGNWQGLIPLGFSLVYLAWRRKTDWRPVIFYIVGCAGAAVLILVCKYLINRPRPQIVQALEKAPFASFPSGHTTYSVVTYGLLVFLIFRFTRIAVWLKVLIALAACVLVTLIGGSRIYLGAHFPSDVTAGALLGLPWLIAVILGFEYYRTERHPDHPKAVAAREAAQRKAA